jgi:hypothetical protein
MITERNLDVSVTAIKSLLIDAYSRYEQAFRAGDPDQRYWDGYIRALHHVLEMEGQ